MSSSLDEWLSSANKRYIEAKDWSERLSQNDSEDKPFESKYKAKEIITDLLQELSAFDDNPTDGDLNTASVVRLVLKYELGTIDLDTEDIGGAQKEFEICIKLLNDLIFDKKSDMTRVRLALTLLTIVVNNQLAFIWCSRSDYKTAETYLKVAESEYIYWDKNDQKLKPLLLDFLDVFALDLLSESKVSERANDEKHSGVKNVESGYTLTIYLLAQTYEKSGEDSKSAAYCHQTLRRQYKYIADNNPDLYDRIDWSLNAATLSQYFAINSDFNAARHHICCALKVIHNSPDIDSDKYKKGLADLNRIIVKYSLMLLEFSANAIRNNQMPATDDLSDNVFRPYLLNEPEVEELEKTMHTFPVRDLPEAQKVFKYANNCLNESMVFYTLDERASDYIECIQDRSKLFQYLIPYDSDLDRQCKMHKRRIDALEELFKQISPQHFLGQCRQILFELGEIHSQMADLKIHLMNDNKKSDEQQLPAIKKINLLLWKAISNYQDFVKTFEDKTTNCLPEVLPDDYVRPILLSKFSIGRLHSKLISIDTREQLKNWNTCEEYYNKVKDYLERNPEQSHHLEEELPLLEEMLKLIPGKMQMILNSTMY